MAVLAPDSICFEDRRRSGPGDEPREGDAAQHLMEMAHRLVQGRLLMTAVLADAAAALGLLAGAPGVDPGRVGVLGHSYGGHVALWHAALDERVAFACVSGAAGTIRGRIADGVGIGLEQVIPAILDVTDADGLLALIAPRPALLVSATHDPYARDADRVAAAAAAVYAALGAPGALESIRVDGGHPLDEARFRAIVEWVVRAAYRGAGSAVS